MKALNIGSNKSIYATEYKYLEYLIVITDLNMQTIDVKQMQLSKKYNFPVVDRIA